MRTVAALFAVTAAAIAGAWAWLGAAVEMPQAPLAQGEKLQCVSYAPFRGTQNPFGPDIPIDPRQIEEDIAQLKTVTDCIRTYSIDLGLNQIPAIAQRHGMKVMQGIWLSSNPQLTRHQIDVGVALAKQYPDVIIALIVGNEVILRGEMSGAQVLAALRDVKAQVSVPVTYADVWEFWVRNRELASVADFVTVHILPYWEDFPIPVHEAAKHVDSIRKHVADVFPGKEILVGEFGWPSAGRMREGALPSPSNQARALQEVIALAKREGYRANLIEAYDQPWKRKNEGTVGGHWGLFDADSRQPKFTWGAPVSDHPNWPWQALGGIALAALMFGAAAVATGGVQAKPSVSFWSGIGIAAFAAGTTIGWTFEKMPLESLTAGDWIRLSGWTAVAVLIPIVAAAAAARGLTVPRFAEVLGRPGDRPKSALALVLGALVIVVTVLALQAALGLVFDPRYADFPFSALTGAVVPLFLVLASRPRLAADTPGAERIAAVTLSLSAVYIVFNESWQNWQSVWFCAGLVALALTLLSARDEPG